MPPNQPDRMRSARYGIERDFAFERIVSWDFLWNAAVGGAMQHSQRLGFLHTTHHWFELFKNRRRSCCKTAALAELVRAPTSRCRRAIQRV